MTNFPAYAANFEIYPGEGAASHHLLPLLSKINRVDFTFRVANPSVNQGQMESDFDKEFEKTIIKKGASPFQFNLPHEIPQELDFAFTFKERSVAVEIEKSNREKILRDILKCHMYLYAGADFSAIVLPKNYAHKHGVWDLFEFGVQRFKECKIYGFGTEANLGRIILIGFEQFDISTNERFSREGRERIRGQAKQDRRE